MSVRGTKTEKNLLAAFAGESQARNRYTYFAQIAEKEGYPQIADIFLETADHERMHAKTFFKSLEGGQVELTVSYPAGILGSTLDNLQAAAQGEQEEWSQLYPVAAQVARSEGFEKIAILFESIAQVEAEHEKRYKRLADNIKHNQVFIKPEPVKWKCRKCGLIHEGTEPPMTCPACRHPKKHFEIQAENY